jgi:acyl dehydratase
MMEGSQRTTVHVGDTLPELVLPPVNRTTLALFAGASGDHNPIHIDLDFARKAGMPDVFAQGMLGMAWLGRLMTRWMPQRQLRGLSVRFQSVTQLGHVMTCRGKVTEIFEADGERRARVAIEAVNQYGQVATVGDAVVALG